MNTPSTIREQAAQIDAGAEALRQRLQGGKTLRPWPQIPNSYKKKWREYATVVLAAAAIPLPEQTKGEEGWREKAFRPTHRHKKRGSLEQVIGYASLQNATNRRLAEADALAVYRDEEGKLWARHIEEFNDGRFEELSPASATPPPRLFTGLSILRDLIKGRSFGPAETLIDELRKEVLAASIPPASSIPSKKEDGK